MAEKEDRKQAELAEKVAKHADLSVNVVLRVFYALKEHGYAVVLSSSDTVPTPVVTSSAPVKRPEVKAGKFKTAS